MNICVYGAASDTINKAYIREGEKLGRLMAQRGHTLVYGAGATGLMGAVSRGMAEKNGYVIGIVPDFFTNEEILNFNCNKLIRTVDMRDRKEIMEKKAEAYIVTPGGIGTYDEFFEILTLKQLGRHNKPIALLNTKGFYNELLAMTDHAIKEGFLVEGCRALYPAFETPEEVLDYIENYQAMDLSHLKNID